MTYRPLGFRWQLEGKLAGMADPGLNADVDRVAEWLREQGVDTVVCLTEFAPGRQVFERAGLRFFHLPIGDFSPPSDGQIESFVSWVDESVARGRSVVVHCHAGQGRTGTMLACYLVHRGATARQAIAAVRDKHPGSIETPGQERAVIRFAARRVADDETPRGKTNER